jgi:hypothetical protein
MRARLLPLITSIGLLLATPAGAQPDGRAEEFRRLEQGWMDALAANDSLALERYLAEEFSIIGGGSTAEAPAAGRTAWLAVALRRPFPRHEVRIIDVLEAGDAVVVQAVLTGEYPPMHWIPRGGRLAFLITDTWVHRDGRWQVLARHSSLAGDGL